MAKDRSASKDKKGKKEKKDKKDKKDKKERKSKDIIPPISDDTTRVSKPPKKEKKEKKEKPEGTAEALLVALAKANEEPKLGEGTSRGTVASAVISEVTKVQRPLIGLLVPFAKPLAEDKLSKKVLRTVKKAAKNKSLKRGVKEVVKALRKSPSGTNAAAASSGLVILAADISPMDVISHIPVLCEDHNIPYIFVTSRAELGAASATKRPTSVVMIVPGMGKDKKRKGKDDEDKMDTVEEEGDDGFKEAYDEAVKLVEAASNET